MADSLPDSLGIQIEKYALSPHFCANNEGNNTSDREIPCLESASKTCDGCHLVQYCSKSCQRVHWPLHKRDCKSPLLKTSWKPSWDADHRTPAFGDSTAPFATHGPAKFLWGNMPALDLINLGQNEGVEFTGDLRLLFAASGDLRNVVKTLAELPKPYTGHCQVVVNDRDQDIVFRNAILLLTALHFSPTAATAIMLHLWYSALIPTKMLRALQEMILPRIEDVCTKIQAKPANTFLSKKWTFGARSVRLVLKKEGWNRLRSYFDVPKGLSTAQAQAIRTSITLAPERKDYVDRALYSQPPTWRVCMMKFRQDGILLPFGWSRDEFDTPNPTFYQSIHSWPMEDNADPLNGWPLHEVLQTAMPATKDVYGNLFFYLQDIFRRFCQRIDTLKVSFQLLQADARKLPGIISESETPQFLFDRIESSNIADTNYLGLETTLATFGPLLNRNAENPHATLLALFLNAVHQTCTESDNMHSLASEIKCVQQYLPMRSLNPSYHFDADIGRIMMACAFFRDFDKIFDRYMQLIRFLDISKAEGLTMKSKNTIVQPWPVRLKRKATPREFEIISASNHTGCERYVEWTSAT